MVCSVLGPVSLAFGPGQPHMRPCRYWGAGLIALAGGMGLASLGEQAPSYLSQVFGLGLAGLALTFAQASARSTFDEGRRNVLRRDFLGWALLGILVLALLVLDRMAVQESLRHLVGMGLLGLLCCRVAYAFDQRKEPRERRPLRIMATIFGLFGVSLLLYGAFALARTNPVASSGPGVLEAMLLVGLIAGLLLGTILLMWIMTERIQFRMRQLVYMDSLTGALNRAALAQQFEREAARMSRSDSRFAILLIDIDRFRHVNDAYGHAAGDRLLVTVVEIVRSIIRQYDLIGRLDGNVFMLLMPGAPREGAAGTAERVRREIERQASSRAALRNPVTVSIGVAVFGEHGNNWDAMLRAAEAAVTHAKAQGSNRVDISLAQPAGGAQLTAPLRS